MLWGSRPSFSKVMPYVFVGLWGPRPSFSGGGGNTEMGIPDLDMGTWERWGVGGNMGTYGDFHCEMGTYGDFHCEMGIYGDFHVEMGRWVTCGGFLIGLMGTWGRWGDGDVWGFSWGDGEMGDLWGGVSIRGWAYMGDGGLGDRELAGTWGYGDMGSRYPNKCSAHPLRINSVPPAIYSGASLATKFSG